MIRKHLPATLLCILLLLLGAPTRLKASWFANPERLVVIDGDPYSSTDFSNWWRNWKEPGQPVPETPEPYVNWLLMLRDARLMQLDDNPGYRHKVEVFLKFRTLMLLKKEEIDSRLQPPAEKELRKLYDRDYLPRLGLAIIELPDRKAAAKIIAARQNHLDPHAALREAGLDPAPVWKQTMVRPALVKGPLEKVFAVPRRPGDRFTIPYGDKLLLVEVVSVQEGSADDFANLRQKLKDKLIRRQSRRLNRELLARLKKKYRPVVHSDRLAKLHLDSDAETRQAIILEIGDLKISGNRILPYLAREKSFQSKVRNGQKVDEKAMKEKIINNIITQTLIGREALARHYEEKPPFKEVYQFYRDNRMVIAWKKAVIEPRVKISDEEVAAAWRKMADHFKQPDEVDIAWVRTADRQLAQRLQARLDRGEDFFKVMTPSFGRGIESGRQPVDRLPRFVRKVVAGLADGQVSAPVSNGQETVFIKLIRRYPGQPRPLQEVAGELRKMLYKKRYRAVEKNLLEQLKSRSEIKVDSGAWRDLRRRLLAESRAAQNTGSGRKTEKGGTRP